MAAISETLRKAVEDKDIVTIRSSFYTIILSDPLFQTGKFDEAFSYVKERGIQEFVDAHDGEELIPEAEWDEEYFDMLASRLQDNFSEERMKQIRKVAEKLSKSSTKGRIDDSVIAYRKHVPEDSNTLKTTNSYYDNDRSKGISITDKKKDYFWIGILGIVVSAVYIFKYIFKKGK